jgi:hypothetical protein
VRPAVFTETVWAAPFVVPLPGRTESHGETLVTAAVYETAGPVLVTFSNCEGMEPPTVPVKVRFEGVGTLVTLNVTGTCSPLFVAPAEVSVMNPLFMPGDVLVGSAETVIAGPPVVPMVDDTDSQFPVLEGVAVNATLEFVDVVTLRLCVGGEAEFTELKVNEEGAGTRLNDGAVTVKLTVTVGVVLLESLQVEKLELEAAL